MPIARPATRPAPIPLPISCRSSERRSPVAPTLDDETERAAASPPPSCRRRVFDTTWGRDRVGDCRTSKVGVPPTPSPSPQGGGESAHRLPLAPSAQLTCPAE